jgi:hypothetical protein
MTTKEYKMFWQHCKDAFLETSKQVLGYKSSKKREWMSQDTWNKIKERRELKKRGLSAKNERELRPDTKRIFKSGS